MRKNTAYRCFVCLCVTGLLALALPARAQESAYSLLGLGEPVITSNPRLEGISAAAVALLEPRTINDLNPATWSWMSRTRIEARIHYATTESVQGDETTLLHKVSFGGFAFGSPIWDKYGMSFALGFSPITQNNFQTTKHDSAADILYVREGGASQLFAGLSARVIPSLALAGRFDIIFGNASAKSQVTPNDELAIASIFERDYATSSARGTFGLAFAVDSVWPDLYGLTFGATFSTGANLDITRRTLLKPSNSNLDSTIEENFSTKYPSLFAVGLAKRFGDRYRAEIDFSTQDLSSISVLTPEESSLSDDRLSKGTRYSAGFERLPIMGDEARGIGLATRVGLRLGFSYSTLPFKPDGVTNVSEMAATFGFNLPLNLESLFDFSVTLGERTPQNTAIAPKEKFIKVGCSISLSEKWFSPTKTEDD
jgi:hypothetical protein